MDLDDTTRSDLRAALISGVISMVIAVPVSKFALDWYVAMTVSVMTDPQLFSTLMSGALRAVAVASFFSGSFSAWFARRALRSG